VKSTEDFSWKSEMRYYFDSISSIFIEMVDTRREYGFEYLGNQGRLVITPLTDRCQRILMTALKLFLGGAPEGPAGTGKTETTKDLAKALGKKCVVFNCSDSLDHTAMAKFFKGLCYCGAWACFDEFNRMEQEVLSVVAEQITCIQLALLEDRKIFDFEGEKVTLDMNCAVFITMNPGYAGRSELPDNLKALFRPIAMMIPDYSMIAEIFLYSYGFSEARVLAQKLVSSFKLASEQLSSQKHYDYGMRAVSSVIKKAGLIKRSASASEEEIVLKAIQESMVPKFLPEDIPLFEGILSDLFPGLEVNYSSNSIVNYIDQALFVLKLHNKQEFLQKALELHEMLSVRHGNMLVGEALTGKSTILEVLAKAYSFQQNSEMAVESFRVEKVCINPKSMTLEQLMGKTDETTHDWADGVLSYFFRVFAEKIDGANWVVFDGPVDALWVENLNTVLDDNKKLCLNNGEIIKLSPSTRVIFEVEDLEQASPATVSRCGMVYLHPSTLDWRSLVHHWLKRLPQGYSNPELADTTLKIFEYFIDPCVNFLKSVPTIVEFHPLWAVKNVISITEALMLKSSSGIKEHNQEFNDVKNQMDVEKRSSIRRDTGNFKDIVQKHFMRQTTKKLTRRRTIINEYSMEDDPAGRSQKSELFGFFLFALAWGFGGFLEENNKKMFNETMQKLYNNSLGKGTGAVPLELSKKLGPIYHNDSFFTHYFNIETKAWESWTSLLIRLPRDKPNDLSFFLVPCSEIVSRIFLLNRLVPKGYSALVTGASGTGKTAIVKKLLNDMDNLRFTKINNTLSAQSTSQAVKELMESRLNKRKKNVLGGELGKRCVVVIDDLNMPVKEQFGAIPPLELLRTAMDKAMWFNIQDLEVQQLEELIYLAVMAAPGGGRQALNMRLMRHMCLVTSSEYCSESLDLIFKTFLSAALDKHSNKVKDTISQITNATIDLYQTILSRLPPTPSKSHYTFNLRDITRVFQGIAMMSPVLLDSANQMYKVWCHECLRVFSDRLIGSDSHLFTSLISKVMEKWIHLNYSEFIGSSDVIFCNFIEPGTYQECTDISFAREKLENALEEYNSKKDTKLEMVFFDFAIIHLSRICRVTSSANGHVLLIGTGGSGRRSLCRMAGFLQNYEIFELQVSNSYSLAEWREDLKALLTEAGASNSKVLFTLKDYEINNDVYFENINNILNSGEVPNLFTSEDKEVISEKIRELRGMNIKSAPERWETFIQNIKKNLHVVLCMSPVGDNLKKRLRQFPSFTSCCSINWMQEWPEDALRSVTQKSLKESGISKDSEKLQALQEICVVFHYTALQMANNFKMETRRVFNITSSHYLLLLKHVHKLLEFKQGQIIKKCEKYKLGVKKIEDTEVYVEKIKQNLIDMKPVLEEKTKMTEEILKNVHSNNIQADQTRSIVSQEQKDSAIQAEIASKMKRECEDKLNKAIPELEAAIKALKTLKKDEINEVRNMQKPPYPVQLAVEAVVIINKEKPTKVTDPNDKSKISFSYFETGKKMMKDPNFLKKLQKFDKDSISPETIEKLQPHIENPKFEPENVKKASVAAEGLCKWVRAMVNYYHINKDVKPKQESLRIATETLEAKQSLLREKEKELRDVEELIMTLKGEYESNNQEKQRLVQEIKKCEVQVVRASKLIEKLKGEKERWAGSVEKMQKDLSNLVGDIILSAGMMTYFGNFTGGFRERLLQSFWVPAVESSRLITCSSPFLLKNVLSDELTVQNWHISHLPTDKASIENAIILSQSLKWPLFIDPQNQALRWISKLKQVEKSVLTVIKPGFEEFYAVVENSMFLGHSLWIENVGETLDPLLLPLINKSYTKQPGGFAVRFGENFKQIDRKFFLFMSTTVPNPLFPPETSAKVNLLNFTITPEGLSEQLLALVCKKELPKETEDRNKLIAQSVALNQKLQDFEDLILNMLQTSGENILDDEVLINSLTESKTMAEETERKLQSATAAEQRINDLQTNYSQIAALSAVPFFAISDLQNIDHVYIFSMDWYLAVFLRGVQKALPSKVLNVRVESLIQAVREEVFTSINMCLFDKDKLLFSFLLAVRINNFKNSGNSLNSSLWRFFLTGISSQQENLPNPDPSIFHEKIWKNLVDLSSLNEFSDLPHDIQEDLTGWKLFLENQQKFEETPEFEEFSSSLPEKFQLLGRLERLLLFKCLKPEFLVKAVESFIKSELGEFYLKRQLFSISQAYSETNNLTPMVFILTSGDEPQSLIKNLSNSLNSRLFSISLGKGQKEKASRFLKDFASSGDWLLLQNCHLMPSWMPELENILQRLRSDNEKGLIRVHPAFRLFLTTKSSNKFPITILQTSIKIINEAPTGLKHRLKTILKDFSVKKENEEFFSKSSKAEEWQKLLFGLCFFHCQIIERQKFGSLGWNVKYEFSSGDLKVSQRQLKILVEKYLDPPYASLIYLTGECNYGGRVTDDFDRRILNSMLQNVYKDDIMYSHFRLSSIDSYRVPECPCTLQQFLDTVETFPEDDSPELFGLHPNASISYSISQGEYLVDSLVRIEAKSTTSTVNEKHEIFRISSEILNSLMPEFNLPEVKIKYPLTYAQSLNTFLTQELEKFNILTRVIRQSLAKLRKAIDGQIVMTHEIESLIESILKNNVPELWTRFSYISCKKLMEWVEDLKKRLTFFDSWIKNGNPKVFWFSGFFFPQSFLTSLLQNCARKDRVSIDSLRFEVEISGKTESFSPEDGCLINGLFIEGARWDSEKGSIEEAELKVLSYAMPTIWLKPVNKAKAEGAKDYHCPVYRVPTRAGTLSTTGHSTNYVMTLPLPSSLDSSHWVLRGVALLTQSPDFN
jgi:dynein heavy chain